MKIFLVIVDINTSSDIYAECEGMQNGSINEESNDFSNQVIKTFSKYNWFISPVVSKNTVAFDSGKLNNDNLLSVINILLEGLSSISVAGKHLVLFDYAIGVFADPKRHKTLQRPEDWEKITESLDTANPEEPTNNKNLKFLVPTSVIVILILIRFSSLFPLLEHNQIGLILLFICSFIITSWAFLTYEIKYPHHTITNPVDRFMFALSGLWITNVLDLTLNTKYFYTSHPNYLGYTFTIIFPIFFIGYIAEIQHSRKNPKENDKLQTDLTQEGQVIGINKTRLASHFFAYLMFIGLGFFLLPDGNKPSHNLLFAEAAGWACIVIFNLAAIYTLIKISSKNQGLILNASGIIDNSNINANGYIPWHEVTSIKMEKFFNEQTIVLIVKDPNKYLKNNNLLKRYNNQSNHDTTGSPITIVTKFLDLSPEELFKDIQHYFEASNKNADQRFKQRLY